MLRYNNEEIKIHKYINILEKHKFHSKSNNEKK